MLVLLPMNVADILSPRGGMSHTAVFTLFGIHSTKYVLENKQHLKHLDENKKVLSKQIKRHLKGATSAKS